MNRYHTTSRFWLVFILTICVLCILGCGGSDEPLPEECTTKPYPEFIGPVLPCSHTPVTQ